MSRQNRWSSLGAAALGLMGLFASTMSAGATATPGASAAQQQPAPAQLKPEIRKLLDDADRLLKERKFPEAVRAAEAALTAAGDKREQALAAASRVHKLGHTAYDASQLTLAKLFWEVELGVRNKLAPDSLDVATSLTDLGDVARNQGDLTAARNFFQRSLKIREEKAPGSLNVAASLNGLGVVAYSQGDLVVARDFHQRALKIREEKTPGSIAVAGSLNNLGNVAFDQGDLPAARDFYLRALKIQEEKAPGSLNVATSLNNLGGVALNQGDLTAARDFYLRALKIKEEKAPGSLDVALSLNNLGSMARDQGDLPAARDFAQRALKIQEGKAPGSLNVAHSLNNLGLVARDQGDLTSAREFFQRALKIREEKAPGSLDVAASLDNLGSVARDQGDFTTAQDFHLRALKIQEEKAPGSLDFAAGLNNLGIGAHRQGDLLAARDLYQRALKIYEEKAPGSLNVAASLYDLGLVASDQGDLTAARDFYQRALKLWEEKAPGSLNVAASLNNLGSVARGQGDLPAARAHLQRAWRLVQSHSQQVTGDEARRAFQSVSGRYASNLERVLVQMRDAGAALRTLEEGRAQALQQALSERILERTASPDAMKRYQEALNRERIARAEHARALTRMEASRSASADETARLKSTTESALSALTQARVAAEAAWAEVKRTSPRGALADPMPFDQARASLKPGEIYLAYSIGEKESILYLAPAGKRPVKTLILKFGDKDLDKRVAELTREITDSGSDPAAVRRKSRALAVMLFPAPALAAIRTAKRVILSPDGPLWDVPWSALVLPTGEKREPYLGLAKPLLFAQSLSLHARAMSAPPTSGRAGTTLALGGCLFDAKQVAEAKKKPVPAPPKAGIQLATRGPRDILRNDLGDGNWEPLNASGPEAQSVASLYGAKPVTGVDATETEVRKRLAGARVVHFATHGRYFAGDPLLSGIILTAPAPGDAVTSETDGVLEAAEVLDPALKINADVVVLSACGTGRGKRERAEGLVGLVRCWQIAGARSVVASQWSVADASTGRLMTAFHQGLKAGLPKDEAMRRAMADLAAHSETAHPFYWAPFLVTGDPRAMGIHRPAGEAASQ